MAEILIIALILGLLFLVFRKKKEPPITYYKFSGSNAKEDAARFMAQIEPSAIHSISGASKGELETEAKPRMNNNSTSAENFYTLLKEASAYKKNKEINKAIAALEEAREIGKQPHIAYMAECEIKYAHYLQQAGRNDDGWRVLNEARINFQFGADQARICDAMRLFLQREGSNVRAVPLGIIGLVLEVRHYLGLYNELSEESNQAAEPTNEKIVKLTSIEGIRNTLRPLLKKAKKEHLESIMLEITQSAIFKLPHFDEYEFNKTIQHVISQDTVN